MNLNDKSRNELVSIAEALNALSEKQKYNRIDYVFPDTGPYRRELYKPHVNFMNRGVEHRFRVFMGGNRSGKSFTGAVEIVYHATGLYPKWWRGRILKNPRTIWIVAESGALFRDSLQELLCGSRGEEIGTGLFPQDKIVGHGAISGISGAIGTLQIKHKSGHIVNVIVKTYEMAREQFQAAKVDAVMFDEEPPMPIYTECLMRLMGTGKEPGIAILLFTPLKGYSDVILEFLDSGQFPPNGVPEKNKEYYICTVNWDEVPHLTAEDKETILSTIPINERDARTRGIPSLGSGKIYPVAEEFVVVQPFEIPEYWPRAYGYDFGWHNTAVVWIAQDPTTKVKYLYAEYKRGGVADYVHAQCVKSKGEWIPGICDPSNGRKRDDEQMTAEFMRSLGLNLIPGYNAIHAGISKLLHQFESGLLKIFSTCTLTLDELRVYRYDTKNPNMPAPNQKDHLMDALKYCDSRFDEVCISEIDADESRFDTDYDYIKNSQTRDDLTGY